MRVGNNIIEWPQDACSLLSTFLFILLKILREFSEVKELLNVWGNISQVAQIGGRADGRKCGK